MINASYVMGEVRSEYMVFVNVMESDFDGSDDWNAVFISFHAML